MLPIINSTDFKNELRRGLTGGYLFYGAEGYLASYYAKEARKRIAPKEGDADFCIRQIDAPLSSDPLGELDEAMGTLAGFGMQRLVEVYGLNIDGLKAADFDRLVELCRMADETSLLILRTTPDLLDAGLLPRRPSARFAALADVLRPVAFEYETPAKLSKWVSSHFAAHTVAASPETAQLLIARCGRDMSVLAGEIEKLSAYVLAHGRQILTAEDVREVSVRSEEMGAFDFSNAVLDGNVPQALTLLGEMRSRRDKPELILGSVSRIFSDLITVAALRERRLAPAEIAARTKLHEFKVSLYLKRLDAVSPSYPSAMLNACLDCDRLLKTSSLDGYSLLERLLLQL